MYLFLSLCKNACFKHFVLRTEVFSFVSSKSSITIYCLKLSDKRGSLRSHPSHCCHPPLHFERPLKSIITGLLLSAQAFTFFCQSKFPGRKNDTNQTNQYVQTAFLSERRLVLTFTVALRGGGGGVFHVPLCRSFSGPRAWVLCRGRRPSPRASRR